MKVSDLIKALQNLNPDDEVFIELDIHNELTEHSIQYDGVYRYTPQHAERYSGGVFIY